MNWQTLKHASLDDILDWVESQPWCRAMADCAQDAEWHSEGDVWTHTKLVCQQLARLEDWSTLTSDEQTALLFTALSASTVGQRSCWNGQRQSMKWCGCHGWSAIGFCTWLARDRSDLPVVSLDAIRGELDVAPTERCGDQVFNSAVILGKAGELLCLHRKINELEIGHPFYAQGDRLNVAATELGTLGLMICADAFAKDHVLSRSLCYMGADILLSPSAWAVPADHDNETDPYGALWKNAYQPVAQNFSVWIAGVSNVGPINAGPWAGRKCIGCSLVVGPDGAEVAEGPYGVDAETILYVDVKTVERPARGDGWSKHWTNASTGRDMPSTSRHVRQ